MVWFKKNVPRWGFILWLLAQEKLNTKDRLHKQGIHYVTETKKPTSTYFLAALIQKKCGLRCGGSLLVLVGLIL